MITIDQLLESVDLDFEPRWVTKDEDGTIICWAGEPRQSTATQAWIQTNPYCCGKNIARHLKLAEFENKPWQECLYEVPRKTTKKIKKLEPLNGLQHNWLDKINELVDAVNKHADIIRQIGQWGSSKGEFLWCETLTKFEPNQLKGAK